ncbi:hypothetical protein [Streptacidiphilus fuscans]|uniref:Uncharacterized protein n=1 Tax=Streptacidiphilus fuscans TaxID=2789292 RepID=A0A931BBV2_9ACTN|nr:hypothetical protein [Streptacidiphilus fuscans]MBF9073706.1 hypothetical protein [Streptacidiphilus fuscans]
MAATTAGTTTGSTGSAGWTLRMPSTVVGLRQTTLPSDAMAKINSTLQQDAAPLGVTGGTPLVAVYDDPQYDVYVIVAGYNGSGFDPAKLTTLVNVAPKFTEDGAGDRITTNSMPVDPGPHGGAAGCASEVLQNGDLATESTLCSWMTATTMGSVSYYPKPDHQQMVFGTGPDVIGKLTRDVRQAVEQQG